LVESETDGRDVELERRANEALLILAQQLREVGSMFNPETFDVEAARRALEASAIYCSMLSLRSTYCIVLTSVSLYPLLATENQDELHSE
jgi:hypothetical protein